MPSSPSASPPFGIASASWNDGQRSDSGEERRRGGYRGHHPNSSRKSCRRCLPQHGNALPEEVLPTLAAIGFRPSLRRHERGQGRWVHCRIDGNGECPSPGRRQRPAASGLQLCPQARSASLRHRSTPKQGRCCADGLGRDLFFAVGNASRGKGIGRMLLAQAMNTSRAKGKAYIRTKTSNRRLSRFYQDSLGAAPVQRFTVLGQEFVVLKWKV